jgi:tripartite motif-containing protein 71
VTGPPGILRVAALLAPVAALSLPISASSCRKEPSGPSPAAQQPPAPAPTEAPVSPPSFSEAPAAGVPPYAELREPRGAALDGKGRLWVADFGNSRLRVFDSSGGYLGGWGGKGSGTYGFNNPAAVAVAGDTIYVADTWNGRVEAFTLAGEPKAAASGLYGPRGVAAGPGGAVFVADTGNNRLMIYDASLKLGRVAGSAGPGPEQFSDPVGVAAGASGAIYVADVGNRRVQILDGQGRFVRRWSVPGWATPGEPSLAVGANDTVYVSDPGGSAVFALTPDGRLLRTWTSDDGGRKLSAPTGLALDERAGALYVVDKAANTVSKLSLVEKKTP